MKKLIALLMAILMATAMLSTAMAYEAKKPETPRLTHTLVLTDPNLSALPYNIQYEFQVKSGPNVEEPKIVNDRDSLVVGTPSIGSLQYTPADTFDAVKKSCTKTLSIDWTGVEIKEPGVYYWVIEKKQTNEEFKDLPEDQQPSNYNETLYLYVYATVAGSEGDTTTLDLTVNLYKQQPSGTTIDKVTGENGLNDQYPSKLLNLKVEKKVTGNQGSHSQYFPIKVKLTAPTSTVAQKYIITGVQETIPANAYDNQNRSNPTTVEVPAEKNVAEFVLWLRHGDVATIDGLLYDTEYLITENPKDLNNDGTADEDTNYYQASVAVYGSDPGAQVSTDQETGVAQAVDGGVTVADTKVTFTNTKSTTVPTGIDLQTSAPVVCLLMAMGLMLMVFAGKRKEETF